MLRSVAVCCPDECAFRLWLQKWKLNRVAYYNSLESMLENEHLDLVEILTPTYPQGYLLGMGKSEGDKPAEADGTDTQRVR
jgi:hypothetical protein